MKTIAQLRQAIGEKIDLLNTPEVIGDAKKFDEVEKEIADLRGELARMERAKAASAQLARPTAGAEGVPAGIDAASFSLDTVAPRSQRIGWTEREYLAATRRALGFTPDPAQHFSSLGEQLMAIARYYLLKDPAAMDTRLVRAPSDAMFTRAPSGASEMDPSSGGFLVQNDFATAVFARAYDMGQILSRVQRLGISTNSNSIKIPGVDETSRATGSRWGGVQSYWVAEGNAPTSAKPKFRLIELDLKKLMSLWYVTDEMMADASVMNTIANQAFSEEVTFMTEDSIFRGTGAGQPLGILNAKAKIAVAKETGQAARTIVYENVLKMWSRMWGRSRQNAIWHINQDVEPQLYALSQIIGTAGVPVYLPANGLSGQPYGTLFGRPVIATEYSDTIGSEGDIALCDWSQYVLADKGGMQAASSMHVAFSTDEMTFRIVFRVDGEPIWHDALTPYKGSNTLSPFITLAAR